MSQDIAFVYENPNKVVLDAFDMLTASMHIMNNNKEKALRTFTITSCNPEEGKTSLAISLAFAVARTGWKTLLIDADMRKPSSAKRLSENMYFGLADYLIGGTGSLNEAITETNVSNLSYLSSGLQNKNPIDLLCSKRFEELMDIIAKHYHFVFFDTPALNAVVDAELVAAKTDATILVVRNDSTSLHDLKRIKDRLERAYATILGVVLNKVNKREYTRYVSSYNYFFNSKRFIKKKKIKDHLTTDDNVVES